MHNAIIIQPIQPKLKSSHSRVVLQNSPQLPQPRVKAKQHSTLALSPCAMKPASSVNHVNIPEVIKPVAANAGQMKVYNIFHTTTIIVLILNVYFVL